MAQRAVINTHLVAMARIPPLSAVTMDPGSKGSNIVLSNANLTATGAATTDAHVNSTTSRIAGKVYVETTCTGYARGLVGIANAAANLNSYAGNDANGLSSFGTDGIFYLSGNPQTPHANTWGAGNVVCIAIDFGAKLIWERTDGGVWNLGGAADPGTGVGGLDFSPGGLNLFGPYFFALSPGDATTILTVNFGNTTFAQTPPTGYGKW